MTHILNLGAQDLLLKLKLQNYTDLEENDEIDNDKREGVLEISVVAKDDASPIIKLRTLFLKLKYSEKLCIKLKCCGTVLVFCFLL